MIRRYSLIFLFFFPPVIQCSNLDSANELRTFFTTSLLRQQLDALRDAGKYSVKQETAGNTLRKPVKIILQGVVIRDKQPPVIFINNKNTIKSRHIDNEIIIDTDATRRKSYNVPVRVKQKSISLKPGQQWSESNREIQDNYQIKPPKKATNTPDNAVKNTDNIDN